MKKKGFTIVELIIVIAVIGILAAILIPTFANVIDKANAKSALSDAKAALTNYAADLAEESKALPETTGDLYIKATKAGKDYFYILTDGELVLADPNAAPADVATEADTHQWAEYDGPAEEDFSDDVDLFISVLTAP